MKCARLVLSVIAAGLLVAPASAAIVNPVMDFGIGYAKEGTRIADDHTSTSGDVLTIVGHVVQFQEPFDDLDPNDPTKEYTYVYTGMVSQGTVIQPAGSFTFYNTDYTGGTLRVYCDTNQDADFVNMTGFDNGDMILEASVGTLSTQTRTHTFLTQCSGSQNADVTITGGSLGARLPNCASTVTTGAFSVCSSLVPYAGYFGMSDTKLDADCPVPTEESSWSRIKQLLDTE